MVRITFATNPGEDWKKDIEEFFEESNGKIRTLSGNEVAVDEATVTSVTAQGHENKLMLTFTGERCTQALA